MRSDLENILDLELPDGVETRAVSPEEIRPIFDAHWEAFRGTWDFVEASEKDFRQSLDDPLRDVTMWKIAWVGDTVVGQVKSFINEEKNAEMGYRRGYTEYISTHVDWRNRGIAGALLAASLRELNRVACRRLPWVSTPRTRAARSSCTPSWGSNCVHTRRRTPSR